MDTAIDNGLKTLLLAYLDKADELRTALGATLGVNERHALALRLYSPEIYTPVGTLKAMFRNVEVSKTGNGRTVAYHRVEYSWQGQLLEALVRCEIGADGRPFVAQQFPHKSVK